MAAPRLRFRVDVSEANYPILARFRNDPQFSRASFLAALEIGVIYLYAHDDERRRLTDLLKGQMARDFEDQSEQILSEGLADDKFRPKDDQSGARASIESVAPTVKAVSAKPSAPAKREAPAAPPAVVSADPSGQSGGVSSRVLSPAARGMMSAYSDSFKADDGSATAQV
jgi:hypothetical protein